MNNEIMRITKKRWLIFAVSCLINLCIGSLYAWSVFTLPLVDKLNSLNEGIRTFTVSDLSIVFTIANSVGPITMISGGRINDKFGPKWVIFVGGIVFGSGMIFSGFATSIPQLIIGYGLGCGLGMGLVYGCTINNSVKFFPEKRGLIGGIATATYGLSSVIIPPIANALLQSLGTKTTFLILGGVFIAVMCIGSIVFEVCPPNFYPHGFERPAETTTNMNKIVDKNWKGMLQDKSFYLMITILLCGAFSGLMMTSQASPMAQKLIGFSVTQAAQVVSILALFNASGRILAGLVSDKIGRIPVLFITFILEAAGLFLLTMTKTGSPVFFIAGIALVGLCFGSIMGVYPGLTADQFGAKNNSVNYGILFIGFALAGFFGPTTIGKILNQYNSYYPGFYIALGITVIGALFTSIFYFYKKSESKAKNIDKLVA